MEPAPELEPIVRRILAVSSSFDIDELDAVWSHGPHILAIGTDAAEWFDTWPVWRETMRVQWEQRSHSVGRPRYDWSTSVFRERTVAWFAARSDFVTPFGRPMGVRATGVLRLEQGEWKLVHGHFSAGIPNEQLGGLELPTRVEAVASAVAEERPPLHAVAGLDGNVTVLFTDIEGSTKMAVDLGDEAWMQTLAEHNAIVRAQIAAAGGMEVKSQGDGFMAAFATPLAALRCAAGIQEALAGSTTRVRIGLHSGPTVVTDDDFFGRTVILAARISAYARGEEILVSSRIRDEALGSNEFAFGPAVHAELKGFEGRHELYPAWRA